jgi:hypothetical protein
MIGHYTVGVADPAVARDNLGESLQKEFAVSVVEKDPLARVASAGQMIDCAGKLQAKRTCHNIAFFIRPCVVARPDLDRSDPDRSHLYGQVT